MLVFYRAKQAKQVVLGKFSRCELGMMIPSVVDMNRGITLQHSIKSQGVIPNAISK